MTSTASVVAASMVVQGKKENTVFKVVTYISPKRIVFNYPKTEKGLKIYIHFIQFVFVITKALGIFHSRPSMVFRGKAEPSFIVIS